MVTRPGFMSPALAAGTSAAAVQATDAFMGDKFSEPARSAKSDRVDSAALEEALRRHVRGEVRFDNGSRALYATDGSNYRQVPIGVVVPRDKEEVIPPIALCRDHQSPVL